MLQIYSDECDCSASYAGERPALMVVEGALHLPQLELIKKKCAIQAV